MNLDLSISDFLNLDDAAKVPYIGQNAILYSQQFTRADLDAYCRLAEACRVLHKNPAGADFMASLLRHRQVLNFFVQPSSRTFLSFSAAQGMLGMRRLSVRDVKISSMSKGETLADSLRTFMSYVDLVVMRHPDENAGAVAFWVASKSSRRLRLNGRERPIPVVSAGSGMREHPTQSLLDIYTLEKSFEKTGGIDGKKLMLVGDLKRGRTVRSLAYLMHNYQGVQLYFAAPEEYQMQPDVLQFLDRHRIPYHKLGSIDEGIAEVDAVYMTRIQDEWDHLAAGAHVSAQEKFIFRMTHLQRMKPTACLLHPLPKRDEIEEGIDYCGDPRVVYWRQERNGMWMRVGIIATLFEQAAAILERLED